MIPMPSATTWVTVDNGRRRRLASPKRQAKPARRPDQENSTQQRQRHHRQHSHRADRPAQHIASRPGVLRLPQDQPGERARRQRAYPAQPALIRQPEVTAQHAQGRHAAQGDDGRDGESEQQHESRGETLQHRHTDPAAATRTPHQRRQAAHASTAWPAAPSRQPMRLAANPSSTNCCTCRRTISAWLAPRQRMIAHVVQMPAQIAARGQRHGHRGQDHAQQCRQAEELLGPLQRRADLGARIAHVLHALPRAESLRRGQSRKAATAMAARPQRRAGSVTRLPTVIKTGGLEVRPG